MTEEILEEETTTVTEPATQSDPEPDPPCTLIEAIVLNHLATNLSTIGVYAERPKTPPAKYYLIENI